MAVAEIAVEARRLAERARAGALTTDDLVGGTFTVTNLGAYEIDAFTPIINPPQVAILGVGRILEKPALHQGAITARSLLTLSLTFDHRVVDGAPAAAFLQALIRRLGAPEDLFR
jgi:pyruvate dehydrogenase E2 component (dihydrolipoamide acetyltransferase)